MKSSNFNGSKEVPHDGYVCDGCETTPIYGTRFHCEQCEDYDLC